jgi:hypothetical protein
LPAFLPIIPREYDSFSAEASDSSGILATPEAIRRPLHCREPFDSLAILDMMRGKSPKKGKAPPGSGEA